MPTFLFALVAALLVGLLPDLAAAATINPLHGNAWDLYVFGNGRVIFDIMNSIKMLMVPVAGHTGFSTLMLLMATIGFVSLAVAAGFDPSKNLVRMFTYIIVVWAVMFSTTHLTVNLNINDMVADRDGVKETHTVTGVPAMVGLPAALTSQVGWYFTQVIETYFSMPEDFKVAGVAAGQFNIFGKMLQESNEYVITSPELKKSLSAYVTDCVVPAIAMNRLAGTAYDPMTKGEINVTGVAALTTSRNLMATLASAKHNSIMTKYFPTEYSKTDWITDTSVGVNAADVGGFGVVATCNEVYDAISKDVEDNANLLLKANSDAWSRAGIMTPYETAFQSMLASSAAPGGAGASYSRPSGFIMQQAMLNTMSPAFRQAAVQTGNNELMQAAAIAQAEQSQKSAWSSAFIVFNNMMGYVFTVLQAFIFAITPMVIVALMIPGLGRSIFVNYTQVLIWLTLWTPMLATINYIITLFGADTVEMVLSEQGGLSAANKFLLTEKTNDLVIAAQFLGTMTPMFTWGLVKGALAFTEFINHGIGSAFASQAGATAATGNLSMNNMSLDNTSMNKYNTAMSSTIGTQDVNAFANAGSLLVSQAEGGGVTTKSGGTVNAKQALNEVLSKNLAESKAVSDVISNATSKATSVSDAYQKALSNGNTSAAEKAAQHIYQSAKSASEGKGAGATLSESERASLAKEVAKMDDLRKSHELNGGVGLGGSYAGVKGQLGYDAKVAKGSVDSTRDSGGTGVDASRQAQVTNNLQTGNSGSSSLQDSSVTRNGFQAQDNSGTSHGLSAADSTVLSHALSSSTSVTNTLSAMQSMTSSMDFSNDTDMAKVNTMIAEMDSLRGSMASMDQLQSRYDALAANVAGGNADALAKYEAAKGTVTSKEHGLKRPSSTTPTSGAKREVEALQSRVAADIQSTNAAVGNVHTTVKQKVSAHGSKHDASNKGLFDGAKSVVTGLGGK